jgi:site-specific recombinase XerD
VTDYDLLGEELTHRGNRCSSTTVVRYLSSLSHVFTVACNEGAWITENPVRKVSKPKQSNGRTRFLFEEEIKKVLEACQASKCRDLYIAVVLVISTFIKCIYLKKLIDKMVQPL